MIIGTGQIAQSLLNNFNPNNILVFASGVSNSNTTDSQEFEKEAALLKKYLQQYPDKKIYYFSSCALVEETSLHIPYYRHKKNMENLVQTHKNYMICRLPQVFGKIKEHPTLINVLFNHIKKGQTLNIWDNAYRYVIHLNDLPYILAYIEKSHMNNTIINIANPYRYTILELVSCIEKILQKTAHIHLIQKEDGYLLDLEFINEYVIKNHITHFGKDYFCKKMNL